MVIGTVFLNNWKIFWFKLISGDSELDVAMKLDGTASSSVKTDDNTTSTITIPLGVDLNMNKDASLSVSKELDSSTFLTTNIATDGAVTVGFSKNGKGPNLKAPKGSEVTISTDGTSSIAMPATTDSKTGVTSQVVSTLNTDGSTIIEMSFSDGSERTANASSNGSSKSTLSKNALSHKTNPNDNIISDINEKESNKSEGFTNIRD